MENEKREKDPVKVAAGKKGGRPRTVNATERTTVRVSEDWYLRLRAAAEKAKAEGRDEMSMGQVTRLAVELLLRELDARDLLTLFLEDPDQIELEVHRKKAAASSPDPIAAARPRRGRRAGGVAAAG